MILRAGENGIRNIGWFDEELLNHFEAKEMDRDNIPNLVVYYGMEIKGTVSIYTDINTFDKSFTPNGTINIIKLGSYAIYMLDKEKAEAMFTIIAAVISNPNANQDIETAVKIAQEMFVF